MKTILFYDRCELTDLYIYLTKELSTRFKIVHVAFSNIEAEKLEKAGIKDYFHYTREFEKRLDSLVVTQNLLEEIDRTIIIESNGRFNLNSSIQSDRGYSLLDYDEALQLASCHYLTWKEIFSMHKVDLMYHEICSQYLVHIAALLCKKQGGIYRDFIQSSSDKEEYSYLSVDGESFECIELMQKYTQYINNPECINIERVQNYLERFRKDFSVFFGSNISKSAPIAKLVIQAMKKWLYRVIYGNKYDRLKNNIDYWLVQTNESAERLNNIKEYKRKKVKFETLIPEGEKYYYYSIHLEPESTVLYLGDGIYANQVKLIENIAAALPAGTYLYVKDHPHEYAYRRSDDYERLNKVPNIRLFHQSIPGKKLISKAIGVFSINGTAGFEALLLGKQVYCFGKCYYSFFSRVNYIHNIRDARDCIYKNYGMVYEDDTNLFAFIMAFLESSHSGFTSYFGGMAEKLGINHADNANKIASDIIKEFSFKYDNDERC